VLKSEMDGSTARALIESTGVRPGRPIGSSMWLVETAPGMASLELANRLHKTGLFEAVEPNWWTPRARR
jgi:hypothetical protein